MKKMKIGSMRRIVMATLVALMMTSTVLAGTFAKFQTATGDVTMAGDMATWNVAVKANGQALTNQIKLKAYNYDEINDGKIAPGTQGEFTITVENTGDVKAIVNGYFTVTNLPTGMTFHTADTRLEENKIAAGTGEKEGQYSLFTNEGVGFATTENTPTTKSVTIYWTWADNSTVDNELDELSVTVNVTADQPTSFTKADS